MILITGRAEKFTGFSLLVGSWVRPWWGLRRHCFGFSCVWLLLLALWIGYKNVRGLLRLELSYLCLPLLAFGTGCNICCLLRFKSQQALCTGCSSVSSLSKCNWVQQWQRRQLWCLDLRTRGPWPRARGDVAASAVAANMFGWAGSELWSAWLPGFASCGEYVMFNKANTAHHAVAYARNFVTSMGPGICCMSCAHQCFFMPYAT